MLLQLPCFLDECELPTLSSLSFTKDVEIADVSEDTGIGHKLDLGDRLCTSVFFISSATDSSFFLLCSYSDYGDSA